MGPAMLRDVFTMIGRYPLKTADRDRLVFHSSTPACGLARPVANAAEYAREHVRLAVLDISIAKTALRDEPYI